MIIQIMANEKIKESRENGGYDYELLKLMTTADAINSELQLIVESNNTKYISYIYLYFCR